MNVEIGIETLLKRVKKLDGFLDRAQEKIFDVRYFEDPDIKPEELIDKFNEATKLQIQAYDLVRKFMVQNPSREDEFYLLAMELKKLGVEELKFIKKFLKAKISGPSLVSSTSL